MIIAFYNRGHVIDSIGLPGAQAIPRVGDFASIQHKIFRVTEVVWLFETLPLRVNITLVADEP